MPSGTPSRRRNWLITTGRARLVEGAGLQRLAGDRLAAYANAEAQAHYARAVEAAQLAPDTAPRAMARLHANHGKALMILAAYERRPEPTSTPAR